MTISFELTEEDYFEYSWFCTKKEAQYAWIRYILIFCALVYIVLVEFRSVSTSSGLASFTIFSFSLTLFRVLFAWSKPGMKRQIRKRLKREIGPMIITFEEENVLLSYEFGESRFKWNLVESLKESPEYLFVFRTVNDAVIIPKRIFTHEQDLQDLKSLIERKLSEHKN
jgi:hypothetical protein